MSFVDTFRSSVRSLHVDLQNHRSLIAVCMWEQYGLKEAFLELGSDGVLLVKSAYIEMRFVGDVEQQIQQAVKEFGWKE